MRKAVNTWMTDGWRVIGRISPTLGVLFPVLVGALSAAGCDVFGPGWPGCKNAFPGACSEDNLAATGFEWITVPAGSWYLEVESEPTAHFVWVTSFQIAKTETTYAQTEYVLGEHYSYAIGPPPGEACPDCPAVDISPKQAREFCTAIGGRLPSEAEWGYAVGMWKMHGPCADEEEDCDGSVAWCGTGDLQPVAQKVPSELGVYDMRGNASELVEDCWHDTFDGVPPVAQPWVEGCKENAWDSEGGCPFYCVIKGGNVESDDPFQCTPYWRGKVGSWSAFDPVGFRCARDLPPSKTEHSNRTCSDEMDNDSDGETDCGDEKCLATDYCQGAWEENTHDTCCDGVDNDKDGLVDCEDTSCTGTPKVWVCHTQVPENDPAKCSDGIDNDKDFDVDCDDLDCDDFCTGE